MTHDFRNTNKMMTLLAEKWAVIEREEKEILMCVGGFAPNYDAEHRTFLEEKMRHCTELLCENTKFLEQCEEWQEAHDDFDLPDSGGLMFAALRLQAAIEWAKVTLAKTD